MSKQINVCVTYNMSKSQWDSAENCICTSISEKAYNELQKELEYDCWSMSLNCVAGKQMVNMLTHLAKLQGYKKVTSWSIERE